MRIAATCLFLLTLPISQICRAEEPAGATAAFSLQQVRHVALQGSGDLAGQLVDAQGTGYATQQVLVRHRGRVIAKATTDRAGRFAVRGLKPGMHQIQVGTTLASWQLWAADTAPPSVDPAVLVIDNTGVVRGQGGSDGDREALKRLLKVGGLTAGGFGLYWALDYNRSGS